MSEPGWGREPEPTPRPRRPGRRSKGLTPSTKLLLWAIGGGCVGLVMNEVAGRFGVVLAAWFAVVVGLVVVIQRTGGPQRPGESPEDFARRRQSLRRWRTALFSVLGASTVLVASFFALLYYALNSYAENK